MELIDVKTKISYDLEELKSRMVAEAKKRADGKNVSISLGVIADDLAGQYGLAIVRQQSHGEISDNQKVSYGVPELIGGVYIRRAIIQNLSAQEASIKAASQQADMNGVTDPVVRAIARKIGLTQGEVDREGR